MYSISKGPIIMQSEIRQPSS